MATAVDSTSTSERFMKIASGHVCDALGHLGVLTPVLGARFAPVTSVARFAGPAVTLRLSRSRTGKESRGLTQLLDGTVRPGDVVVIDIQGILDAAVFGSRAGLRAQQGGAVGVVINGGTRDIDELDKIGLAVHTVGRAVPGSEGKFMEVGTNVDLVIDGILIRSGDWLVADASGICVVPKDLTQRVLELAEEREAIDVETTELMRRGGTLSQTHRHFHDDDEHLHDM